MDSSFLKNLLALTLLSSLFNFASADDWYEMGNYPLTRRMALTIENPYPGNIPGMSVTISLEDLQKKLPGLRDDNFIIADSSGLLPFQKLEGNIIFRLPLKANEKKSIYIYASDTPLPPPAFEKKTAVDNRLQYRSFENNLMAFRTEVGPHANTSGLAVDLFGKTKEGKGLQLRRFYELDYHRLWKWGMDIMHIGPSPGMGGLRVFYKGKILPMEDKKSDCVKMETGSLVSSITLTVPLKADGKVAELTRKLTVFADFRAIRDEVEIKGLPDAYLKDISIGIGLRNFKNETWKEVPEKGYAYECGTGNQPGVEKTGLGLVFRPESYIRTDFVGGDDGGHFVIIHPSVENGKILSNHWLAAYWDKDGEIADDVAFAAFLKELAEIQDIKPSLKFAGNIQSKKTSAERPLKKLIAVNPSPAPAMFPAFTVLDRGMTKPAGLQLVDFASQKLLFANEKLQGLETRELDLRNSQKSAFKISRDANGGLCVDNGFAKWNFDRGGLKSIEKDGKKLNVKDSVRQAEEITVEDGPIVCMVKIGPRQYLIAAESPCWQVASTEPYELGMETGRSKKFMYSHIDQFWNPEMFISFFQKKFVLCYPADYATLFNQDRNLGITLVPTASAKRWTVERENDNSCRFLETKMKEPMTGTHGCLAMNKAKGTFGLGAGLPDTAEPAYYTAFFAIAEKPEAGKEFLLASSLPMIMEEAAPGKWEHKADINGNGFTDTITCSTQKGKPAFDNESWCWDMGSDGTVQAKFEFGNMKEPSTGENFKTLSFFGDLKNLVQDELLDEEELKYPLIIAKDWTENGSFLHGGLFRGGIISSGAWQMQGINKHYTSEYTPYFSLDDKFDYAKLVNGKWIYDSIAMEIFDIDGDGDCDVIKGDRDNPESSLVLDLGDMNPLAALLYDPTTGYGMGLGADLHATYTDNFTEYHGGRSVDYEGKKVLVGGHDWPQMCFSIDKNPAPSHRMYMDEPEGFKDYSIHGGVFENGKWKEYWHPHRWVLNLNESCRKSIDGYSYINKEHMGGRHWNSCIFTFNELKLPGGNAGGFLMYTPVVDFKDRFSGKTVSGTGPYMPQNWDGKYLPALDSDGKVKDWLSTWKKAMDARWNRVTVIFCDNGTQGPECMHACVTANQTYRWDCITGGTPYKFAYYASPIIAGFHMNGASLGHAGTGRTDFALFEKYFAGALYDYQMYSLDIDIERPYYSSYLSYLDQDGDGIIDTYLVDSNNDGLYEKRIWYDKKTQNLRVANSSSIASIFYPLEFPQESLAIENYEKLVALYKKTTASRPLIETLKIMPEEKAPFGSSMIPNPSFEKLSPGDPSSPASWLKKKYGGDISFVLENSGSADGQRSAVILSRDKNGHGGWNTTSSTILPGKTYNLYGWYMAALESGTSDVRFDVKNETGKTLKSFTVPLAQSPGWEKFGKTFTAPEGSKYLWIILELNKGKGKLAFDGLQLSTADEEISSVNTNETPKLEGADGRQWTLQGEKDIPVLTIDIAHAESPLTRTVFDLGQQGFSRLLTAFSTRYCLFRINRNDFSEAALAETDILLITNFSAAKSITPEEIKVLKNFVRKGGIFILLNNDFSSEGMAAFNILCKNFNMAIVPAGNEVVSSSRPDLRNPGNFGGEKLAEWLKSGWKRLYFKGPSFEKSANIVPLVTYKGNTLAARSPFGKGMIYAVSAGDLLSNAFSTYRTPDTIYNYDLFPVNNQIIDKLSEEILKSVGKKGPATVHPGDK